MSSSDSPQQGSAGGGRPTLGYVRSEHSLKNKLGRALWAAAWAVLYRPSPRPAHFWRRGLLRLFGATVDPASHPYPSARVWAPWNLTLGPESSLGDRVDCYCVARVTVGANVTVSQGAFLCAATHDYEDPMMPLVVAPITIGDGAWVCANAFVGPGVTVGAGAVVGACAVVTRDVPEWTVVAGNPARAVKTRKLKAPIAPPLNPEP
ncbi:MAG TPA: putative colanic acid biosynthesis acetyltransferase [Tepidisphaeraceae bacterium]|nr:putative colanic acid biosynthesis acetyltransferase [Tepidisphaeraceae bacterium]